MPKNYTRTQPKKNKPKKTPVKTQTKPVSITASKLYWVTIATLMVIFGSVYGYLLKVSIAATTLLLVSVLVIIGFAYYIRFTPSTLKNKSRATFIFAGASVIGFLIWVAIVLLANSTGFWVQTGGSISDNFFAITSLIICLTSGALIGDLIGNNEERISTFLGNRFGK